MRDARLRGGGIASGRRHVVWIGAMVSAALLIVAALPAVAAEPTSMPAPSARAVVALDVLTREQWQEVERGMDRALAWLATQQQADGVMPASKNVGELSQPGVTALFLLALMSRGHLPGEGPYGQHIERGIDFVLSCQHPSGFIAARHPRRGAVQVGECASYNHAIGGLMLSEVYGMTRGGRSPRVRTAIEAALRVSLERLPQPKRHRDDGGGWRYPECVFQSSDSDLSVTSWYLMFLRSCRNAGFAVPAEPIEEALGFVRRCFDEQEHRFWYALRGRERVWTRAMVGAGILSLSLGGEHQSQMARQAGRWLLRHPFDAYRVKLSTTDRFFYGAFYCSHAAFQLGGEYWAGFYPVLCKTLLDHQRPDGSWDTDNPPDEMFGNGYSTSLAVLAFSPPFQLLPIFQR